MASRVLLSFAKDGIIDVVLGITQPQTTII